MLSLVGLKGSLFRGGVLSVPLGLLELCCGCLFSVSLPRGAVGWSVVSDLGHVLAILTSLLSRRGIYTY